MWELEAILNGPGLRTDRNVPFMKESKSVEIQEPELKALYHL